ncbi:MAG TPA: ABC transporter substrate-binding protein [Saliniramus sp.]|nr:ABC transporter substrate-binding protein [Saliniramus sp.]
MPSTITIAQPRVVLDDPHACTDANGVLSVFGALFDTLVRRGRNNAYEPALATRWTISDDARSFWFRLREGVSFHDGESFDAQAVRFALERMARPDMGATLGAPGVYAQYLAGMRIEVLNSHELRVDLAEPLADFFDILAYGHIVSPRAIAEAGDDLDRNVAMRAVGTGPYILEEYAPGERIVARANPDHFHGPPAHERIVWRQIATPGARLDALASGIVDIANWLDHDAAEAAPPGVSIAKFLSPTAIIFMFNASSGPGSDSRVRRALNLGIDREALIADVLDGEGAPLHGFVSPVHFGVDRNAPAFEYDPVQARALLDEAGYGEGLTLQVYRPTSLPDEAEALTDAVAAQLAAIGVRFEVHVEDDRTRYANQVRLKNIHDLCVFDSSPMSAFRVLYEKLDARIAGSWWEGYRNPEIERLLDEARRMVDDERREALYRACYRVLQSDPPWLYLYNHRGTIGFRGDVGDWAMPADGVLDVRASFRQVDAG